VYPTVNVARETKDTIVNYAVRLAKALGIIGLFNIQFVVDGTGKVFVIEVNPRASRTIPMLSKITGIPMVGVATRLAMGVTLKELGYTPGLAKESEYFAVKAPVFSFSKITTLDTFLGPEMKSTGEVMGVSKIYKEALYKALLASGLDIPRSGNVLLSINDRDKEYCIGLAKQLLDNGYSLVATTGTADFLNEKGLDCVSVGKSEAVAMIKKGNINLMINTPTRGKVPARDGFMIRRTSIEYNIPSITNLDTAYAVMSVLEYFAEGTACEVHSLDSYSNYHEGGQK
jgi:carbamoyl-phosphate synthase large subunit